MATPKDSRVRRLNTKSINPQRLMRLQDKGDTPSEFKRIARTISTDASCETTETKRKLSALCTEQRRHKRKVPRIMQPRTSDIPVSKTPLSHPTPPQLPVEDTEPNNSREHETGNSKLARYGDRLLGLVLEDRYAVQISKRRRIREPASGAEPTGNGPPPRKLMDMTPDQVKEMDRAAFPPSIINRGPNDNRSDLHVPTDIKTWGQLKNWAVTNQGHPRRIEHGKLLTLQKLHFAQIVAARVDRSERGTPHQNPTWPLFDRRNIT